MPRNANFRRIIAKGRELNETSQDSIGIAPCVQAKLGAGYGIISDTSNNSKLEIHRILCKHMDGEKYWS